LFGADFVGDFLKRFCRGKVVWFAGSVRDVNKLIYVRSDADNLPPNFDKVRARRSMAVAL